MLCKKLSKTIQTENKICMTHHVQTRIIQQLDFIYFLLALPFEIDIILSLSFIIINDMLTTFRSYKLFSYQSYKS